MDNIFGIVLRTIRNSKGLSQQNLADSLDVSTSHICRLETGAKQPSLTMLFRIADALGVSAKQIIEDMELFNKNK